MQSVGFAPRDGPDTTSDDDLFVDPRNMTGLTTDILGVIIRIDPLVVGGLFDVFIARGIAFEIERFDDQGMAGGTEARIVDVFAPDGFEADEKFHRLFEGEKVGAVDHAAGIKIKFTGIELSEHLLALVVAGTAGNSVEAKGILEHIVDEVMFGPLEHGPVMPERSVTGGTGRLDIDFVRGIDEYLVAHLGAPKGIARRIGHHTTAPVVNHVDIIALGIDGGAARGIKGVAIIALRGGRKKLGGIGLEEVHIIP